MNTINIIHPSVLTNEWLYSEYRDIPKLIDHAVEIGSSQISNIPCRYPKDKGRLKFFFDKLKFLADRHEAVKIEINKRSRTTDKFRGAYNLQINRGLLSGSFPELYNDWKPSKRDYTLDTGRLYAKWLKRKRTFTFYNLEYKTNHDWLSYVAKIINMHELDPYKMNDVFKVVEVNTLLKGNLEIPL